MKYLTVKEIAEKWHLTERCVQNYCINEKIAGAKQIGKQWVIPSNAEQPSDGRTKKGKEDKNHRQYHFPLFIYSPFYNSPIGLSNDELKLFEAQCLHLEGKYTESIGVCREILSFDVPLHVTMGTYYTMALSAMTLGNYYEYKKSVSAMEANISSDDFHFEDYKLIVDSIKRFIGWNHRIFDNINPSRLSTDALYLYQYECMLGVILERDNISACALHVYDAFAIQVSAEGIAPLEANIRFALSSLHNFVSNLSAEEHIEAACNIILSHDWISIIAKNLSFSKTLIKEYLNKNASGYYDKVAIKSEIDFNNWRIINKQESGIYPFKEFSPSDISILFMIYQGMSNDQICIIMGLSLKELQTALKSCFKIANVKNKKELKKYSISQLSTWFES